MSDNQAVPSWMQTLRLLNTKLKEVGISRLSFNDDLENTWPNIIVLSYTIDKRHLWEHPYAIKARNASLTSDVFRQNFVMLKIAREMEDLMESMRSLQTQIVNYSIMKRNLKDGEQIDFEKNLLIGSSAKEVDLLKQIKALFENFNSKEYAENLKTDAGKELSKYFGNLNFEKYFKNENIWEFITYDQEKFIQEGDLNIILNKKKREIKKILVKINKLVKYLGLKNGFENSDSFIGMPLYDISIPNLEPSLQNVINIIVLAQFVGSVGINIIRYLVPTFAQYVSQFLSGTIDGIPKMNERKVAEIANEILEKNKTDVTREQITQAIEYVQGKLNQTSTQIDLTEQLIHFVARQISTCFVKKI